MGRGTRRFGGQARRNGRTNPEKHLGWAAPRPPGAGGKGAEPVPEHRATHSSRHRMTPFPDNAPSKAACSSRPAWSMVGNHLSNCHTSLHMQFEALKRAPAYVMAENAIKDLILSGELGPGALLPGEHDLAEQLGVTRPTVREAMRKLESSGLVNVVTGVACGSPPLPRYRVPR